MIGRIVWFAAVAAIGLLTAALQFDLRARSAPEVASLVPAPLRNYAQVQIAQQAMAGSDAALALAEAERLVTRRPVPAEYLTLLAAAQFKANQPEAGARTIQIAGQRGWRDPVAQEAVMRIALVAGDKPEAARRYAALFLREDAPEALLQTFGPQVLDDADGLGQRTFVAIVVGGDRWHATFLRRGARLMPPKAFSAIATESMARGAAFDCKALGTSIGVLTRRDAEAAANLLAASQERCPDLAARGSRRR